MTAGQAGQAPGVVKVRLAGAHQDIEAVAALLAACGSLIERPAPYANKREPGVRVYLTLQIPAGSAR